MFSQDVREMVFAGTLVGYVWYDVCHFYIHHSKPLYPFLQFLKKYHMNHHYRTPLLGFGVSNPLWDLAFGTEIVLSGQKNKGKNSAE